MVAGLLILTIMAAVIYLYANWVERHNKKVRELVEKKKAEAEICQECPKRAGCYALCFKYRLWEADRSRSFGVGFVTKKLHRCE